MKRLFLFLITNLLVVISISMMSHFFGLNKYLSPYGINYQALALMSLAWGMIGSFISLLLSKYSAKVAYGVIVIDPYTTNPTERLVYSMVSDLARKAGLKKTPEVGYYESAEVNAFATGWGENHSLVAVSAGLINQLDQPSVEAVIAHEISHIKNGDMVTMTLIQGVVNSFAIFFARILAFAVTRVIRPSTDLREGPSMISFVLTILFEILLTFLGSIVVFWFSRHREYKADAGGARLTSSENMRNALIQLGQSYNPVIKDAKMATMKINGDGIMELFSTHPRLEKRIKALEKSNHA